MLSGHIFSPSLFQNLQLVPLSNNTFPSSSPYFTTGWFGCCSPFYYIFCNIFNTIHFFNYYILHILIYKLIYILGRIRPSFDLYLVIQGHSHSLYYTVSGTGILFHLVQVLKILNSNSSFQRSGMTFPLTFTLSFKVSIIHFILL